MTSRCFSAIVAAMLFVGLGALCPQHAQGQEAPLGDIGMTESSSGQFRVYGVNSAERGLFASFAERVKDSLLAVLLAEQDTWVHLIALHIEGDLAGPAHPVPVSTAIRYYGDSYGLNVSIRLGANFSRETLKKTLYEMLLLEIALRDVEREVTGDMVPRWLKDGLPGAIQLRLKGKPSRLFESLFKTNRLLSAKEILESTSAEDDSVSRSVYEASASGFVMMLLSQSDGPEGLRKYVHALGGRDQPGVVNLLSRYFPILRGKEERMEKQWVHYCAKLAAPQALEFLTVDETEVRLTQALGVSFLEFSDEASEPDAKAKEQKGGFFKLNFWHRGKTVAEKSAEPKEEASDSGENEKGADPKVPDGTRLFEGGLEDFSRFIAREDRASILEPAQQRLMELSFQSFPVYRPIVADYQKIVLDLQLGKPAGIKKRLEKLARERELLRTNFDSVKGQMDRYVDEQVAEKSGAFDEYQRRANEIEESRSHRSDPISRYLDFLESELK